MGRALEPCLAQAPKETFPVVGCSLQRYLSNGNDGYENDDAYGYCMRISFAHKYIRCDLVTNLLTEHQKSCNSNEGVEKILYTDQSCQSQVEWDTYRGDVGVVYGSSVL